MRETVTGLALAAGVSALISLLPDWWARGAVSNLLTLVAAIYVGFSLDSEGPKPLAKQVLGCVCFVLLALLGLWSSWWFLVTGFALHGVWGVLHYGVHHRGVRPYWHAPFYAVFDWAMALFVMLRYAAF